MLASCVDNRSESSASELLVDHLDLFVVASKNRKIKNN